MPISQLLKLNKTLELKKTVQQVSNEETHIILLKNLVQSNVTTLQCFAIENI